MPSIRDCGLCHWLRVMASGMSCAYPGECVHKYKPNATYGTSTRPLGYRTPEDRLADRERRLDQLERDRRR